MPRVERNADITLVVLVYRSLRWLDWCMASMDSSIQDANYRWCVVANDATEEVRSDPRITVDWQNADTSEPYINRVYRAWNEGVLNSPTQQCILLNSDMFCTDHALDELVKAKEREWNRLQPPLNIPFHGILPCGLLVEHGRIPSGMPEYVQDFGTNPDNFRREDFLQYAEAIREPGKIQPGRLYQPVLFDRQEFLDLGKYPEGNLGGISGDKILFDRYVEDKFQWVTCMGSVWYHAQCGEQLWP